MKKFIVFCLTAVMMLVAVGCGAEDAGIDKTKTQLYVSNYDGGYTTNYYDQYGGSTGSAKTRSNYGGGTTTNYYDQYGGSIGSSTTRSNYSGGTTTTYYDAYGNSLGSSYDW